MKKLRILVTALMLAGVCAPASAQEFNEDFESYAAGAAMHGVGGWKGWDNAPGAGAPVSSTYAYRGRNSVEILASTDLVYEFTPDGGLWELTAMQYIPSGKSGITYFILLNQYHDGGPNDWSAQTQYDLATGAITPWHGTTNSGMTVVFDRWVKIRWIIDLTANTFEEYYNGVKIAAGQWDDNNHTTLQAIDLYGNGAGSVYYDDIELSIYVPYRAYDPSPADGAVDVIRETQLSWQAGDNTAKHDVYFGTSYEDVEAATTTNPLGVLVSAGQDETSFDPGRLEIGQTYYWRIDEVDGDLAGATVTGRIWHFTAEPFSYPLDAARISATASSMATAAMTPTKTIDGSGLNTNDQHSGDGDQMWLTIMGDTQPWIQYAFDKVYRLDKMLVWNSNQRVEPMIGLGVKAATVEVSTDGEAWTALGDFEFAQGNGLDTYTANTTVDFGGAAAKYVKLTIKNNWGGIVAQFGLSEVRFFQIPVSAREPNPASGATDVSAAVTLSWRPGREAASHQVFLGTDAANLSLVDTVDMAAYEPDLAFNQTYFWKVVEANEAETPSLWDSDIWSFSTGGFITVDDFEGYNDDDNRIYNSWIDGLTDKSSGSQVGYDVSPFAETRIVHGGGQAMPLKYDNSASPFLSEATRTFGSAQDWTVKGADTLSLYFQGVEPPAGSTGEPLYVTLKDSTGKSATVTNPDAAATGKTGWQQWKIPLSEFTSAGVKMNAVKSMVIGVGKKTAPAKGGTGIVYIDDIGFGHPAQ